MPELNPEQVARQQIDAQLVACGWVIQDYRKFNPSDGRGIALREVPLKSGICDYLLMVDRKAVGVIEAKKTGTLLSGVAIQSAYYAVNLPDFMQSIGPGTLPFAYESTGVETMFRDERDPSPRSRRVFTFHRPETLEEWLTEPLTLRGRLAALPTEHPLTAQYLRNCQVEGIAKLEESFAAGRPRALIQMATGAGKTYTACSFAYRLIKYAGARRVLFLVDRANLGRQAMAEFQQFVAPDTGRKFTEVYNVQHLTSNKLDEVARVTICTVQRLYSMLRGEELDEDLDEKSGYEVSTADDRPKEVVYNPAIPIETFDFIVTDECHRSIYGLWRQVLEYFDAFLIGLTATPSKQTIGFFGQNLVMEYNHERAVADGVNVGYEVYRIRTAVTEQGGTVEKGFYVDKRSKDTRAVRWERLDEDLDLRGHPARPLGRGALPDPHRAGGIQGGALHRALPGAHPGAQDADLLQGRFARRGYRAPGAGGLRQGERLRQEDHLQDLQPGDEAVREVGDADPGVPHLAAAADRGHGGHDRHRHRHQAARVSALPA